MKKIIYCIALLVLSLLSSSLSAQVIDPTVEVSREFDVKLTEIRKPDLPINIADSLQSFDMRFDYSIFNRPYKDLYEFSPYQMTQIAPAAPNKNPFVYAKLGCQYPLMPSGELYLQAISKGTFYGGLYARHNSFFGDMQDALSVDETITAKRMRNLFGGIIKYAWETGEFYVDVNYHLDKYDYLFKDINRGDINTIHDNNRLNLSFRVKSAQKETNSLYYDFGLAYKNTGKEVLSMAVDSTSISDNRRNLVENHLNIDGSVGTTFDVHRVYLNMGIEYASYSGVKSHTAGVVEFTPMYEYKKGRFFAKLGVKFSSRYGISNQEQENENIDHGSVASNIFPDVDAKFALVQESLWLHAIVTGGNDINAYSSLLDKCPYIDPQSQLMFTSNVVDAKLALESVIKGRVGLNIFASYSVVSNMMTIEPVIYPLSISVEEDAYTPWVYSDETNPLFTTYQDVNTFSAGLEPFWKSKDLTLGGSLRYNIYRTPDKDVVTNLPKWQGRAYVRYNWRERIVAGVECKYSSAISGNTYGVYEVPSIVDLDVNLNFILNSHFSLFLKGGNLLNRRNQYIPLYIEPGINFGGGFSVNF